jgi:hypothetical protein
MAYRGPRRRIRNIISVQKMAVLSNFAGQDFLVDDTSLTAHSASTKDFRKENEIDIPSCIFFSPTVVRAQQRDPASCTATGIRHRHVSATGQARARRSFLSLPFGAPVAHPERTDPQSCIAPLTGGQRKKGSPSTTNQPPRTTIGRNMQSGGRWTGRHTPAGHLSFVSQAAREHLRDDERVGGESPSGETPSGGGNGRARRGNKVDPALPRGACPSHPPSAHRYWRRGWRRGRGSGQRFTRTLAGGTSSN